MVTSSNANLSALALNRQSLISPKFNSGVLGFSLGVGSTQILPGNTQASSIIFHNPGTIAIYVCPAVDANGNGLTPGVSQPGNFIIEPGATWEFSGNGVAGVWLAAAASASGNAFTVVANQGT